VSTKNASIDTLSMCESSTKVYIVEVMGRYCGWLAAAAGVIKNKESDPPHILLFPEVLFNEQKFIKKVK